jgi:NADPH:quinone reductase-like Zn-dependent oxidoreductase
MKAVIASGYGGPEVLSIQDVEKPKPRKGEVLIKVKAASVNSADVRMRSLDAGPGLKGIIAKIVIRLLLGIIKPRRVPGVVLAGEIVELGNDVDHFKIGDEVFAMTGFSFGAYGEYCALSIKKAIALKPKLASFEEASALPFGGNTALYFLRKAGANKNKKVLIYGSTGAVGSSAVQVAKYLGCNVTAVCSKDGLDLTKTLGADKVYDYQVTDLGEIEGKFDIVFDAVGKISEAKVKHLIEVNGQHITVNGFDVAKEESLNLEELARMFDDGKLKATIDRTFKLEEIVEANIYVDAGRKKGNVVLQISK